MITAFLPIKAQSNYNFATLTTKEGLSSNTVNVILQDRYGLMWFGTPEGLNKFDGSNFTTYRYEAGNNFSLPGNDIRALYRDKKGRLWIGTSNGLCYYDDRLNHFVRSKAFERKAVRSICGDHLGNLWVGSYTDLRRFNPATGQVVLLPTPAAAKQQESVWAILSLFEDSKNRIWVGSQVGAYCYDVKTHRFQAYTHQEQISGTISNNYITGITEDASGQIWLSTLNGLNLFTPENNSFRTFKQTDISQQVDKGDLMHVITRDSANRLWIGTEDGVRLFDCKSRTFTVIKPDSRNAFSLKSRSVRSILIGSGGMYWIGLNRGGVSRLSKHMTLFDYQQSNAFDPYGLRSPYVTSFAELKRKLLYVGTEEGGLQLFDQTKRSFSSIVLRSGLEESTAPMSVLSLKLSRHGDLWIGTNQHGLFRMNPITRAYQQYLAQPGTNSISHNVIYCLEEDHSGKIWIGTNGAGLCIYDPQTEKFSNYEKHEAVTRQSTKLQLNGFIRAIAESSDGNIWVGSYGTGIAIFNPVNHIFTYYNKHDSGLSEDHVLSILHDRAGNTWVGTNGGLSLFDKRSGRFKNYSEKEGLINPVVFKILEDSKGMLWLSTNKGITSFNPQTRKFRNFTKDNGVQESPFIVGSGFVSSTGEIFFGGESGFNYFNPLDLPQNNTSPPVILTELKVSNSTVVPAEGAPIDAQLNLAQQVRLKYGQNFSISYVAVDYVSPRQNTYAYRLVGYDTDWNEVGRVKTAAYTNLDPGEYTFQVRAENGNGKSEIISKSIKVVVLPPWWRTWYAYFTFSGLIVLALFLHRRRSIQKLRMQFDLEQEKLMAQQMVVRERLEAQRLHDLDLMKIKFLTNLSHEFRTPISLILVPLEHLLKTGTGSLPASQAKMIQRNARRLLNLVNQLLDFRKLEEHELRLNLSPGDLITFVRDAADSFHDFSEQRNIRFIFNSEIESLPACFDHDKVERIVFNLLSNAFKFTAPGGRVAMLLSLDEYSEDQSSLCIEIIDNGIGIPKDQQDRIFHHFFQGEKANPSTLNQGSGIGLTITKEFVQMHGGKIKVESESGKGTTFTVCLPVIPAGAADIISGRTVGDESGEIVSDRDKAGQVSPAAKRTILIVEDSDDFRFYLKENLKATYHVVEAVNGKEGWKKALANHPDLVVSDINMPVMSGIELSQKIKADSRTSHIPIIFLTAITEENEHLKGLQAGASDYLTKPFSFEILHAKIENLLKLNHSLKATYSKQVQITGQPMEIVSANVQFLTRIRAYIEENINNPELNVEDLSKFAGMSRGTLYRKVLEFTGQKPVEYIREIKLEKAVQLLEKSDLNISQIAYMTGFGTPNYFARIFKAKYHMLPSEYVYQCKNQAT